MSIKTRLNQLEERIALKNGDYGLQIIVRHDDESEDDAIKRLGMGEYPRNRILVAAEIDERI